MSDDPYVPLSVRDGGPREKFGWWVSTQLERLALRLAPWLKPHYGAYQAGWRDVGENAVSHGWEWIGPIPEGRRHRVGEHVVPVKLDREELHMLVQWGFAIRKLDGDAFTEAEQLLLDKLKAFRDERLFLESDQ